MLQQTKLILCFHSNRFCYFLLYKFVFGHGRHLLVIFPSDPKLRKNAKLQGATLEMTDWFSKRSPEDQKENLVNAENVQLIQVFGK